MVNVDHRKHLMRNCRQNPTRENEPDSDDDSGVRVGREFQAVIPDLVSSSECYPARAPERALLMWSPTTIPDHELDRYLTVAREKYGYNTEQAFGLLYWHQHDINKSMADLPHYAPFNNDWTLEEKVLFENAIRFCKKDFAKIKQVLPTKSIGSLVQYYYSWKKSRNKRSFIDCQIEYYSKRNGSTDDCIDKDEAQNGGNESEEDAPSSSALLSALRRNHGFRSNGERKQHSVKRLAGSYVHKNGTLPARNSQKNKVNRKDFIIDKKELLGIATLPPGEDEYLIKSFDIQIESLRRQVQQQKQIISHLKEETSRGNAVLRLFQEERHSRL